MIIIQDLQIIGRLNEEEIIFSIITQIHLRFTDLHLHQVYIAPNIPRSTQTKREATPLSLYCCNR